MRDLTDIEKSTTEDLPELGSETIRSLNGFKELVADLSLQIRANNGPLSPSQYGALKSAVTELLENFEDSYRDNSMSSPVKLRIIEDVQREFLPYLMLSSNGRRWFEKPEGYAGDYLTMKRLYDRDTDGIGHIGEALDGIFLDIPPAEAVRNRRDFLYDQLNQTIDDASGETSIMSLACGPAMEINDVVENGHYRPDVKLNLLDMDPGAINYVEENNSTSLEKNNIETFRRNLIFLVKGRHELDVEQQNLIYSAGLIDYFEDDFVVELMNWAYDKLAPNGRMVLGNFHPQNPNRAFMDYVLNWELNHRDQEKMHELSRASKFDQECTNIWMEDNEINLFAECRKSPQGD